MPKLKKDLINHARRMTACLIFGTILLLSFTSSVLGEGQDRGLEIYKITVGEDVIDLTVAEEGNGPVRKQLIEVLLKNYSSKNVSVVVKLVITLPNQLIITFGEKRTIAKSKSEARALFVYPIDNKKPGEYLIAAKVFTPKNQLIVSNVKDIQEQEKPTSFYVGNPSQRRKMAMTKASIEEAVLEEAEDDEMVDTSALQFDPPDLLFQQVGFSNNNSILRGETAHVKLVILNDGGDVAEKIPFSLQWFFEHRPKRRVEFYSDEIGIIAAGEKKVIHAPLTVPAIELIGRYYIVATVDPFNYVKELDEENNVLLSSQALHFNDIALEFPDESHSFAEEGRFVFQWRSKEYNQFKVQISPDEKFRELNDVIEIPKGGKWESSRMVRPLVGELPGMGISMMENYGVDFLYWRVVAKNSQGDITESVSRKFYITLKPETD